MSGTKIILGIGLACFCGGLIIASILIACSFSVVEIEEYGLLYDNNDKSMRKETYNSTRDFVGLGKKFRTYPSGLIDLDYSTNVAYTPNLDCWSKTGVNLYLSLGFYLKLNKTAIYDIYMRFGGDADEL